MTDRPIRGHTGVVSAYQIVERYEVTCPLCDGRGCLTCRQGLVPVYVLVTGSGGARCRILGHHSIGRTTRVTDGRRLPQVAWCSRCEWQQVHTDVPEAYDLGAEQIA